MKIGFIADVISIIAGGMTILGMGGLITWSIFRPGKRVAFQESVFGVTVAALKLSLCLLLLIFPVTNLFQMVFSEVSLQAATLIPEQYIDLFRQPWWDRQFPIPYAVAWFVSLIVCAFVFMMLCACIMDFSFKPIMKLWRRLRHLDRSDNNSLVDGDHTPASR